MSNVEAVPYSPAVPARWPRVWSSIHSGINSGWGWMAIACALVAPTGYLRDLNDRRIGIEKSSLEPCPFNLDEFPNQIGDWTSKPGQAQKLDEKTVLITGSTDHIIRTYVDTLTGVQFSLLLLYGPAEPVLPHTPQVCYPASGYVLEGSMGQAEVPFGDGVARFRTATYARSGTDLNDRARVYHSFRMAGDWSPDIGVGKKFYRSNPGIFKVQLHRPMRSGERAMKNEPLEKFLALFLQEIEARIARSGPARAGKPIAVGGGPQPRPDPRDLPEKGVPPGRATPRADMAKDATRRAEGGLS